MASRVLLSDPTTHLVEPHLQDMILMHKHRPMLDALAARGVETEKIEAVTLIRTGGTYRPEDYDAVILLGGRDIQPSYYDPTADRTDRGTLHGQVDAAEIRLIHQTAAAGIPLLGVCRGAQILNVAFGGNIIPELSDISTLPHRIDTSPEYLDWATSHPVNVENSRFLPDATYLISSRHHQAVGKLGHKIRAVGTAPDGVIEMIEHERLPLFGVQWHPEISYIEQEDTFTPLLDALLG